MLVCPCLTVRKLAIQTNAMPQNWVIPLQTQVHQLQGRPPPSLSDMLQVASVSISNPPQIGTPM